VTLTGIEFFMIVMLAYLAGLLIGAFTARSIYRRS
jgi:uncharacterized protein YneF (UPF0154 family)